MISKSYDHNKLAFVSFKENYDNDDDNVNEKKGSESFSFIFIKENGLNKSDKIRRADY